MIFLATLLRVVRLLERAAGAGPVQALPMMSMSSPKPDSGSDEFNLGELRF